MRLLNYIWSGMIIIGIVVSIFTGRISYVTNAALESAREAVTLALTLLGIIAMWTGLLSIAEKSGMIANIARRLEPALSHLFPDLPRRSRAMEYISTNFMANLLGLGWAATPAGIKAMHEMQRYNSNSDTASRSMCMFMIINTSSLQLISVNIIAFRVQYGSTYPSEIIAPAILVTVITTLVGILFAKLCESWEFASKAIGTAKRRRT